MIERRAIAMRALGAIAALACTSGLAADRSPKSELPRVIQSPRVTESVALIVTLGKAQVIDRLKDPASAQWRRLYVLGNTLCGEINARNSFGGYTGFQRFYSNVPQFAIVAGRISPGTGEVLIDADSEERRQYFEYARIGKCMLVHGETRVDIPDE